LVRSLIYELRIIFCSVKWIAVCKVFVLINIKLVGFVRSVYFTYLEISASTVLICSVGSTTLDFGGLLEWTGYLFWDAFWVIDGVNRWVKFVDTYFPPMIRKYLIKVCQFSKVGRSVFSSSLSYSTFSRWLRSRVLPSLRLRRRVFSV
jgi:hypothetical protein